jgi:Holliday junction resolvase RusA-like endonuclease
MINIRVYGIPASQGSKRPIGNNRFIEASKKLAPWRKAVKDASSGLVVEDLDAPIGCNIIFFLPRPKTVKRDYPTVFPDVDKTMRSTFDALTQAGVWADDKMVCFATVSKRYETDDQPPGAFIEIWNLTK